MNSEMTEITETKEGRFFDRPCRFACASVEPTARRKPAAPWAGSFRGWILYDHDCRSCTASARRFDQIFRRRGFFFLPLQTSWVMNRLGLEPGTPLEEMRVLTAGGHDIGGADAVIFLARQIWWVRPFAALAQLPGMHKLHDRAYRWIAAHRGCDHITCKLPPRRRWPDRIALTVLPLLALLARNDVAPWQFMWLMTSAIFLGCKWLTFWGGRSQIVHVRVGRALAYFFLWPGMDVEKSLDPPTRKNLTALSRQVLSGHPPVRSQRHSAVYEGNRSFMKSLLQGDVALQLSILIASALTPRVLDWRTNLAALHSFLRKLFRVYGAFIVMVIIAFSTLTFSHADAMATREAVAHSLCIFIAIFWGARLFVQFAIFDPRPFLTNRFYQLAYHTLTVAFAFLVFVYGKAAI